MYVLPYISIPVLSFFPLRVLYGVLRRRLSPLHQAERLRISSTRAGSRARDVRPSEGFLVLSPGGGKEERAVRGEWGRRGSMSRTGSQYSSPARDRLVCSSGVL